ncbi:MAG: endolytic transglycosylase MltG, partial [Bacillota bacterium]
TYLLDKPITRLTYKDLEVDSPYNTYLYPGLPYGPIGNPGRQSLEAVFNPKVTEYLFFVAKGDGSHVFTRTYQEHLNAQLIHEDWLKQNSKE